MIQQAKVGQLVLFRLFRQIRSRHAGSKKNQKTCCKQNGFGDKIYSTVINIADKKSAKIKCQIADRKVKNIKAYVLNGDIHDKNDFENTNAVEIKDFNDFRQLKDGFTATLPACSVVKFVIE